MINNLQKQLSRLVPSHASGTKTGLSKVCARDEKVRFPLHNAEYCDGKPTTIRCDNGPEYISGKLATWAERRGIRLSFIQPGKPQQNAYIERYNRTVRYDWLSHYLFDSIEQVQDFATHWLWTYNNERPNMALGGITPRQKLAMVA